VRLRAAGPPSLRLHHSLRSAPCNGTSNQAVRMCADVQSSLSASGGAGDGRLYCAYAQRALRPSGPATRFARFRVTAQAAKPSGCALTCNRPCPLLGVRGMGGIPRSKCDALSLERGAQPEASTASEGSAPNHDEKPKNPRRQRRRSSTRPRYAAFPRRRKLPRGAA
jgi:hypothetical protein